MRLTARGLALAFLLTALSCAHGPGNPLERLEEAGTSSDGSARTLALAGFDAALVQGDVERARTRFLAALTKDPADPYALYGNLLLAQHDGHPEKALELALEICERAPRHPLAVVAARLVGELAGSSVALDDAILHRASAALANAPGDPAFLLRGSLVGLEGARQPGERARILADMGTPTEVALLGPFSPYQYLDFDELTPPERTGQVENLSSPFGPLTPRILTFPDGRWDLSGSGTYGDVYVFAVDVEAPQAGDFVARAAGATSFRLTLDQQILLERRGYAHTQSTVLAHGIRLEAGRHRLVFKVVKGEGNPTFTVSLFRQDGQPSGLKMRAAAGRPEEWAGLSLRQAEQSFPSAQALAGGLADEAGPALATYIAVQDGLTRDRDDCKRLLEALGPVPKTAAWAMLRAALDNNDHTLPPKVARGRATRELELAIAKDPTDIPALLMRATFMLDESQLSAAMDLLHKARAAHTPVGYPVYSLQARAALAAGVDAQADQLAQEALKAQPQLCEAMTLRYDLALRRGAAAQADELVDGLAHCPSEQTRAAEHAKLRGQLDTAIADYRQRLAQAPTDLSLANQLVGLEVAMKRPDAALAVLEGVNAFWPRNAALWKREGEVLELAGRTQPALAAYQQALLLDGSDLALRRQVTRALTGKEILQDQAISGDMAIDYYEKHHGQEEASSTYVLDAAAIRAYPDGSTVDRIHLVQKVLDQSGISDAAEVNLPSGAQVLTLRTRKADGTVLEPESIEGKESVSLPGVAVGDYVEYEYLLAHPARGPAQPGWTATNFYFQVARIPDTWSTYTVVAPKGTPMGADAHNMAVDPPQEQNGQEVFFHEERRMPAYIPEPNAPPSPNEYLPFVIVGAGEMGNDGTASLYSDGYLDRGRVTTEIEDFARQAAGGRQGLDAVRAVYEAVMERLTGRDSGLTASAAGSLAQNRGSRLWLLKASLEALGIPARVVAVRTFGVDPAAYRFPNEAELPYACIRVDLPSHAPLWLDPLVRFAPFGELPETAMGGRQAWVFPEPGRPLEKVRTPPTAPVQTKTVLLKLKADADGNLTGVGDETYRGFEAAQLTEGLANMDPTQRQQALQSALARYFNGADLTKLDIQSKEAVGQPVIIHYEFTVPHFGRKDGDQLTLPPVTFPAQLGRRYVQVSSRKTPLYIDGTESSHTHAELEVPAGFSLSSPVAKLHRTTRFGSFDRNEAQNGDRITIDEDYLLPMARIPAAQYDEFSQFAGEIDLIQARDLVLSRSASPAKPLKSAGR